MNRIIITFTLLVSSALFCLSLPVVAIEEDTDFDLLPDNLELVYGTDPNNMDSDGDGVEDGVEVLQGTDPLSKPIEEETASKRDTDADGLNDWLEYVFGTNANESDTDGDGYSDFAEVMNAYSPTINSPEAVLPRKLLVDLTEQQISYIVDGQVVKRFPVSTGKLLTPTPTGQFAVQRKITVARYRAADYDLPNVKWNMQFLPKYFIHTAYWHNQFGIRPMSHGCVNMKEADAKFLYDYIPVGVPVEIIGKTPAKVVSQ